MGVGAVQADDRVEVDGAACLVLGHLHVGDAQLAAKLGGGQAGLAGQRPAQVDSVRRQSWGASAFHTTARW